MIERHDIMIHDNEIKIEKLIQGQSITINFDENITYNNIYNSEDVFFSILYMSGYLTRKCRLPIILTNVITFCYASQIMK